MLSRIGWFVCLLLTIISVNCNRDIIGANTSADSKSTRFTVENDIREAVLRSMFEDVERLSSHGMECFFISAVPLSKNQLSLNNELGNDPPLPTKDPSSEFIKRFDGNTPPVKGVTQCMWNPMGPYFIDRVTGKNGCLFWLDQIKWKSANQARMKAGHSRGRIERIDTLFIVTLKDDHWVARGISSTAWARSVSGLKEAQPIQ